LRCDGLVGAQLIFVLQQASGFGEAEEVSVYFEFVFATVVWNRDDVPDGVAAFAKQLGDKVDVDLMLHADTSICRMPVVAAESVSEILEAGASTRLRGKSGEV
jgi:hypothetical protein